MQRTLIILKPDAIARGLCGTIIGRFEAKGFRIAVMKQSIITRRAAAKHYAEHKEKPFYPKLVDFITSSPSVQMVIEGKNAVTVCRKLIGKTNCAEADPGTIRGDLGLSSVQNLVHGSDSLPAAKREIKIFFKPSELTKIPLEEKRHVYDISTGKVV